jgi:hypothetical protein
MAPPRACVLAVAMEVCGVGVALLRRSPCGTYRVSLISS